VFYFSSMHAHGMFFSWVDCPCCFILGPLVVNLGRRLQPHGLQLCFAPAGLLACAYVFSSITTLHCVIFTCLLILCIYHATMRLTAGVLANLHEQKLTYFTFNLTYCTTLKALALAIKVAITSRSESQSSKHIHNALCLLPSLLTTFPCLHLVRYKHACMLATSMLPCSHRF